MTHMKYNIFHYEQKKHYKKKKPYRLENFTYLAAEHQCVCPQEKRLSYLCTKKHVSANGYLSSRRVYECQDCQGCLVKSECTKSKYNRRLYTGVVLLKMKKTAHDHLTSSRGKEIRSKLLIEVKAVFGFLGEAECRRVSIGWQNDEIFDTKTGYLSRILLPSTLMFYPL